MLLLLLSALAFLPISAHGTDSAAIETLGHQWRDDGDRDAARQLIRETDAPDPHRRSAALFGLIPDMNPAGARNAAISDLYDEMMATALRRGKDPDGSVRTSAGSLGSSLEFWKRRDSPEAVSRRKRFESDERRRRFWREGLPLSFAALLPWLLAGWMIVSRGGMTALLVGSQPDAVKAVRQSWSMLVEHSSLRMLPAVGFMAACGAAITVLYAALTYPIAPGTTKDAAEALALLVVVRPTVLAAYFLTGFTIMFCLAAFQRALLDARTGRTPSLGASVAAAGRSAGSLLVLSVLMFGALLFIELFFRRRVSGLPRGAYWLARLSAWLIEFGVMAGAFVLTAAMMEGGVGLTEAFRRLDVHDAKSARKILFFAGAATAAMAESGTSFVVLAKLGGVTLSAAAANILPGLFGDVTPRSMFVIFCVPAFTLVVAATALVTVAHMTAMACLAVAADLHARRRLV